MRILNALKFIVIIGMVVLASCSKDEDKNEDIPTVFPADNNWLEVKLQKTRKIGVKYQLMKVLQCIL